VKPVTLNLATRPFRNNVLVGSLIAFVGIGLVSATVYNLYVYLGYGSAYARLQQDQTDDRARIVTLQAEERRLADEVRKRDFHRAYERGKLASELVRKSAFSWTLLFNTLEGVVPPDVVMTAIRPNISADAIVLRIEGVAKNPVAFLSFQDRLLKNPMFTRVFPASERKLNPSLPDVTFLLTCDYLPTAPAQKGDLVAEKQGAAAAETAAGTDPGAAPTGTPPAAAAEAPSATPGQAATAAGPPGAAAAAPGTRVAQASMPVGRDGLPVDGDPVIVLAPGALHTPGVATSEPGPANKRGRRSPAQADKAPKPADPAPKPAAPPAKPATTPAKTVTPPAGPATTQAKPTAARPKAPPSAAGEGDDAVPGAATGAPVAGPAGTAPRSPDPSRTSRDGRVWDPNVPRTMPAKVQALRSAEPKPPEGSTPATRLDMPLSFTRAPVGDVYEKLAKAHGVRFEFGPGVDKAVPVTLNLQGRPLDQALEMLMLQTRQRVTRKSDGVYRVFGPESGSALGTAPVTEEPITGGTP
jgi:hypothetical protein